MLEKHQILLKIKKDLKSKNYNIYTLDATEQATDSIRYLFIMKIRNDNIICPVLEEIRQKIKLTLNIKLTSQAINKPATRVYGYIFINY